MTAGLAVKRVEEAVEANDGFRVLADRLWPWGLSQDKAHIDLWFKGNALAPSAHLQRKRAA